MTSQFKAEDAIAFVEKCQRSPGVEHLGSLAKELIDIVFNERRLVLTETHEASNKIFRETLDSLRTAIHGGVKQP